MLTVEFLKRKPLVSLTGETEKPHILGRWIFILCLPVFVATISRRKRTKYEEELSGRPARLEVRTAKDGCSRSFLVWDKQEHRRCPNPAEMQFPGCFILGWVQQSPPSILSRWLFLLICSQEQRELRHRGSDATNVYCKYLYLIHLNNLALPGALQTLP